MVTAERCRRNLRIRRGLSGWQPLAAPGMVVFFSPIRQGKSVNETIGRLTQHSGGLLATPDSGDSLRPFGQKPLASCCRKARTGSHSNRGEAKNGNILGFPRSGRVTIHPDCWEETITCQGTRAGGIYKVSTAFMTGLEITFRGEDYEDVHGCGRALS